MSKQCEFCKTELVDEAMFCSECGKTQSRSTPMSEDKTDIQETVSKTSCKKIVVIGSIIAAILVIVVVCVVAIILCKKPIVESPVVATKPTTVTTPSNTVSDPLASDRFYDPTEVTEDGHLKESLILSADQTQFFVGQDQPIRFTVYVPIALKGDVVTINDEKGNTVGTIDVSTLQESINGLQATTFSSTIQTKQEGVQYFTAHMGDYRSNSLSVFVTPIVTDEHLDACEAVCQELAAHMESFEELTEEEYLKTAEAWIDSCDDIASYEVDGTSIVFQTKDSIMGVYTVTADDTFGGSSPYEYQTSGKAVELFEAYQQSGEISSGIDVAYLNSGNTNTNNDVLVLRPLYDYDSDCQVPHYADYGRRIADKLGGESIVADNVQSFGYLTYFFHRYGTVFYNSHGNILTRKDKSHLFFSFVGFYKTEDFCKNVMNEWLEFDVANEGDTYSEDAFRSKFYGKFGDSDTYRMMFGVSNKTPCLVMTSNYIMDNYQNQFFDNSVIYFGICYSDCDNRLKNFLINRGAQAYIGYNGTINVGLEKRYFENTFTKVLEDDENTTASVTNTLYYSINDKLSYWDENVYKPFADIFGEYVCTKPNADGGFHTIDISMTGNGNYRYYGSNDLKAIIQGYDGKKAVKWFEGASVEAYRFENQTFTKKASATVGEDGSILLENLRFGYYVFLITDRFDNIYEISLLYDDRYLDDQEIALEVKGIGRVVSDEFSLCNRFVRDTCQKNGVPIGYIGVYDVEDLVGIADDPNGRYILMNDIVWTENNEICETFGGKLNGNGYTISNIGKPLFKTLKQATVRNLSLELKGDYDVVSLVNERSNYGGIASSCSGSIVENCYVQGNITINTEYIGGSVGAIVGHAENSRFENCYSEVNLSVSIIKGTVKGGGITGSALTTVYFNCYNTGNISVVSKEFGDNIYDYIALNGGGITATSTNGTVEDCMNRGNIIIAGETYTTPQAGGICAFTDRTSVLYCRNLGDVAAYMTSAEQLGTVDALTQGFTSAGSKEEADSFRRGIDNVNHMFWYKPSSGGIAGGIVGDCEDMYSSNSLKCCSNEGNVTGSYIAGGLVGRNCHADIENCLNSGDVKANFCAGGMIGYEVVYSKRILHVNCLNTGTVSNAHLLGNFWGVNGLDKDCTVTGCYYVPSCDETQALIAKSAQSYVVSPISSATADQLPEFDFETIWEEANGSVRLKY